MNDAQPVFGRRGAPAPVRTAPKPVTAPEPSAAYLEIAAAARAAFAGGGRGDAGLDAADAPTRTASEEGDIRAYLGPAFLRYEDLWRRCGGKAGWRSSFSLPAAILGGVWLLYRKVYVLGALVILAQAALLAAPFLYARVGLLLIAAVLNRYGKSIVLIAASRKVRSIRQSGMTPGAAERRIEAAGGASFLAAALGVVALAGTWLWLESQAPAEPTVQLPDLGSLEALFPARR